MTKLQVAAGLVSFDRALKGAAWTVGFYSFVFLVIGALFLANGRNGWLGIVIGLILLAEAVYLAQVRSPRAIWVAGLTLGIFSLWLFISFAIGWSHNDSRMGRGIIAALFLAYGAWNLLNSYRSYKLLLEQSDPAVNVRVRSLIDDIRKVQPATTADVVEWKVRGIGEKGFWRMKPQGNLMLIVKFKDKTFGFGGPAERALWISRQDIRTQREGEKWMGKKLNAILVIGTEQLRISIEPAMLQKLESLVMGLPS